MDFLEVIVAFFKKVNQVLLHCIQIYLKKLTKVKWNIEAYILIFQTQNKNYQKDKCSIQGELYKRWYIQCHNPNHPKKIIIVDFFLLAELETKPITFYHHTLKYRNN
jgi:hypothetical protein